MFLSIPQENPEGNLEDEVIAQDVTTFSKKHNLENEESLEPAPDIEIPPPMPVQDQSHMLALGTNQSADISEKFVSLYLDNFFLKIFSLLMVL